MTYQQINKHMFTCNRCEREVEVEVDGVSTKLPPSWREFESSCDYVVADTDGKEITTYHLCATCSHNFIKRFLDNLTAFSLVEAEKFAKALLDIANLTGAEAFSKCQEIAKEALGREVTK